MDDPLVAQPMRSRRADEHRSRAESAHLPAEVDTRPEPVRRRVDNDREASVGVSCDRVDDLEPLALGESRGLARRPEHRNGRHPGPYGEVDQPGQALTVDLGACPERRGQRPDHSPGVHGEWPAYQIDAERVPGITGWQRAPAPTKS